MAGDNIAVGRRKRGLRWSALPYAVLASGIVVLAAALYLIMVELEHDTRRMRAEYRDNLTWYAGQFERELSAFTSTLDAYRLGEPRASRADLVQRFDVFWSRVEDAGSGPVGAMFMNFEGIGPLIERTRRVLHDVEPLVLALQPGDPVGYRLIKQELGDLPAAFREVSLMGLHQQNIQVADLYQRIKDGHIKLLMIFAGVMAGSAILIGLILLEMRQVNALSDSLERRVEDRTAELKAANELLKTEIEERQQAEAKVQMLNEDLERRVEERTAELRAAQAELLRKGRLATLGQLTATVSHELRNPLGTMRTSLAVMRNTLDRRPPPVERSLARIERSVIRCDRIIDELLDFTRISDLEPEPTTVDAWLLDVLNEQPLPDGITVRRELGLNDLAVPFDRHRLRRAVINVFDNACQAMLGENGHAVSPERLLTVRTHRRDNRVELVFEDTGLGIPGEAYGRIFEPLFSTKTFGVGLGLPVVRQIMEQHRGGVEIESAEGAGTRVCMWLPLLAGSGDQWVPCDDDKVAVPTPA